MKDSGNGNVSQILFTYEEAYADARSYSLIFKHYPHDLNSILYRENYAAQAVYSTREEKPNRFPGSILDHWLWIGMLGVLDAVATFHDPPNHGIELPPLEKLVTAHLDIKPANILVDDSRTFRLGDFSHAYLTSTAFDDDHYLTTIPGDSRYRPPPDYPNGISSLEAQSGTKVASAYDIWSLACVLVEVICFVRNGEPDVAKFQRERQDEDSDHRGEFWKFISVPNIRVNSFPSHHSEVHGAQYNEPPRLAPAIKRGALKSCVQSRLRTWKAMGEDCDKYLARAIRQIELMFELGKGAAPTAKSCLQTLSSNVELDRYMFLPSSYKAIGSLGTSRPFEKM